MLSIECFTQVIDDLSDRYAQSLPDGPPSGWAEKAYAYLKDKIGDHRFKAAAEVISMSEEFFPLAAQKFIDVAFEHRGDPTFCPPALPPASASEFPPGYDHNRNSPFTPEQIAKMRAHDEALAVQHRAKIAKAKAAQQAAIATEQQAQQDRQAVIEANREKAIQFGNLIALGAEVPSLEEVLSQKEAS